MESQAARGTQSAFSIFHEHWWLDIATDGRWGEAVVVQDGVTLARLPYPLGSFCGLPISLLPSLVRTLGPAIVALPGKPSAALRRRLEVTDALIDQLPRLAFFEQLFDPRASDAISFANRDFVVGTTYCFRIEAGRSPAAIWDDMPAKTRNVIKKAGSELCLCAMKDVDMFCRFYDDALGDARNIHGTQRMRRLLMGIADRGAGCLLGAFDQDGNLMAACCVVWDSVAKYHLLSARIATSAMSGASSLLIWEAIQLACQRELAFDLDGVSSHGLLRFLSGFGATLTPRLRVRRVSTQYRLLRLTTSLLGRRYAM
jgi:hypothetical protein